MSLDDLAPELVHHIFSTLHSIKDVINLSLVNRHLNTLLKCGQKLPTLFAAAEREFGPIEDIAQLITYNASQPAHVKRQPSHTYALLRQVIKVGGVAQKYVDLYPGHRWQDEYLERRALSRDEAWKLRRVVYRYWLYCEAFQSRGNTRGMRMLPHVVEERAQLLRLWSTEDLLEIEDFRLVLENLLSTELCPTIGRAQRDSDGSCDFADVRYKHAGNYYAAPTWNSWPTSTHSACLVNSTIFYNFREEQISARHLDLPVPQRRKLEMTGWGDEISQYYVVQSMMKLNPAQIMHLHETVVTKQDLEKWLTEHIGGDWFWDNGQTWLDTWTVVLYRRGEDPAMLRDAIMDGEAGITACIDDTHDKDRLSYN